MSLSKKLAIVTGGASGIGRAICIALARNGYRCVVADVNLTDALTTRDQLEKPSSGDHSVAEVDVSSWNSVASLFSKVKAEQKDPADVVVNCAGITRDTFLLDMTETQFDQVIGVNLKGTFLMTKFGAQEMVAAKIPGSIVNISSIIGKTGNIGQTNYAASKAGVVGFTKSTAQELSKFNIRCNTVMPGFIDTPIIATIPDKVLEKIQSGIPLKRKGTPDEIAEVVHFLASDKSSYMTGAVIEVTGGLFM